MKTPPDDLLIALNAAGGLGRAAICRLASAPEPWHSRRHAGASLAARLGVPLAALRRGVEVARGSARIAARERTRASRVGATIVTTSCAAYPPMLRHLPLAPPVLYIRGELTDQPALSMVGARRASPYGLEAAETFSRALAGEGLLVVSGFARGVDAAAHRGALAAGGRTVAVLGCGVDVPYPWAHRRLATEVAAAGALVSEFPCGTQPRPWHFPVRNRIIAALSLGTLVVEATVRSGSLITARYALELGRDVLAVPGRIFDERALGPNSLIADGAVPARDPRDVIEALAWPARRLPGGVTWPDSAQPESGDHDSRAAPRSEAPTTRPRPERPRPELPTPQRTVLAALDRSEPRSGDELCEASGLGLDGVLAALLELELGGHVRRCPGPAWTRRAMP